MLLGGSWVVISRVITRVTILITLIRGPISLLITTPEPPSIVCCGMLFIKFLYCIVCCSAVLCYGIIF